MILITVDGKPSYPAKNEYEHALDARFASLGYRKAILAAGKVTWAPATDTIAPTSDSSDAATLKGLRIEEKSLGLPPAIDAKAEREGSPPAPTNKSKQKQTIKVATLQTYDIRKAGRGRRGQSSAYPAIAPPKHGQRSTDYRLVLADHHRAAAAAGGGGGRGTAASNKEAGDVQGLSDALARSHLESVPPPIPSDGKHNTTTGSYNIPETGSNITPNGGSYKGGNTEDDIGCGIDDEDDDDDDDGDDSDLSNHHVNAYFKPSLLLTCARCHQPFFNNPRLFSNPARGLFNPQLAVCRYHPQYYVCRFHPAELGSSGDGLGYYGNGEEGYDASFWDCCNNAERDAPGCVTGPHVVYT